MAQRDGQTGNLTPIDDRDIFGVDIELPGEAFVFDTLKFFLASI